MLPRSYAGQLRPSRCHGRMDVSSAARLLIDAMEIYRRVQSAPDESYLRSVRCIGSIFPLCRKLRNEAPIYDHNAGLDCFRSHNRLFQKDFF